MRFDDIPLDLIQTGKNPRKYFDEDEMAGLTASVKEHGVFQPILLKEIGDGRYEIIAGERRFRASIAAGLTSIPAMIRESGGGAVGVLSLIENFQRARMSPAEEAEAAQTLLYEFDNDKEETALQLSVSLDKLGQMLALMSCAQEVRDALTQRKIKLGHAELLAAVPANKQIKALKRIIDGKITVSVLKDNLGKLSHKLANAIFDTTQCHQCQYNSGQQRSLGFSENIGDGYCTNGDHFEQLTNEKLETIAAEKREDFPKVVIYRKEDGFQSLQLTADGALGVGEEQAEACKACANYGCAISALPGSEGEVTDGLCFDVACNQQKVAARIKAEKVASSEANTQGKPSLDKKNASSKSRTATANAISKGVTQYRVEQWRKMAAKELLAHRDKAQSLVVGLALTGHLNHVDQAKFQAALERMMDEIPKSTSLTDGVDFGFALTPEQRVEVLALVPCAAAFGVPEHDLVKLMAFLEVKVASHWKLNKVFLDLMTKSEIEVVANELGLKKALKEQFSKLRDGKKDAFIAALLKVDGFEYQGAVPKVMLYDKIKREGTITATAEPSGQTAETETLVAAA